mmetsp:Transcript_115273/g.235648  ORF Transcript_115273/g.235648 Transcript_115273/m.235648 type:complete len:86 (-) Transcript_115273:39-296(-)
MTSTTDFKLRRRPYIKRIIKTTLSFHSIQFHNILKQQNIRNDDENNVTMFSKLSKQNTILLFVYLNVYMISPTLGSGSRLPNRNK